MLTLRTFVVMVCALVASLTCATEGRAETRVAVLYFDNHTADAAFDPLGKGLADMLITDLGAIPGLTIVERARLEELLTEQKLQKSKLSDPATAVKVGKLAGAKYAVTGALTALDPELRVDMRLIEIQTSKVIVAEKVIGKKGDFFALEQELVKRFATGLQAKVPAVAEAAMGVDAALAYGQGLDLADKGDLQGASKRLGETVAKAPDFKLGQTRYQDLLARLYAAKDKRDTALGGNAKAIWDKCNEVVKQDPTKLSGKDLERWFGYRILRGNLILKSLTTTVGSEGRSFQATQVPPAKQAEVKRLVGDWLANMDALVAAMIDARKRKLDRAYGLTGVRVDDEDDKKIDSLDLGMNPESIPFNEPQIALRAIAGMLCVGKTPFHWDLQLYMAPAPWDLEPQWQKRALDAYARALDDAEKFGNASLREREAMRTYKEWGECLVARGKKVEGIQKWQSALDKYPTGEEFDDIEKLVREALQR